MLGAMDKPPPPPPKAPPARRIIDPLKHLEELGRKLDKELGPDWHENI